MPMPARPLPGGIVPSAVSDLTIPPAAWKSPSKPCPPLLSLNAAPHFFPSQPGPQTPHDTSSVFTPQSLRAQPLPLLVSLYWEPPSSDSHLTKKFHLHLAAASFPSYLGQLCSFLPVFPRNSFFFLFFKLWSNTHNTKFPILKIFECPVLEH